MTRTLIDDDGLADEIVQDVAVRVFYALPRWRGDASIRTWTHRIVINVCRDTRRRAVRANRLVSLDHPEARLVASPGSLGERDDPLLAAALLRHVSSLPPQLADVISLRYGAEMSFAEVADALGIPIGTVSTRVRRALAELAARVPPTLHPK